MKAFISYAIGYDEQYILNLLAGKLAGKGLSLVTGDSGFPLIGAQVQTEIQNSALFIGLITIAGAASRAHHVLAEFKQANLFNKPAVLLIEEGVLYGTWVPEYPNTIKFNRRNIDAAMQEVRKRIDNTKLQDSESNAAAWLIGGIAVLALLAYLSDDKK